MVLDIGAEIDVSSFEETDKDLSDGNRNVKFATYRKKSLAGFPNLD